MNERASSEDLNKHVPIVFFTANADYKSNRAQAMAAGALDFLRKQVDGERLLDVIQQAFKRR